VQCTQLSHQTEADAPQDEPHGRVSASWFAVSPDVRTTRKPAMHKLPVVPFCRASSPLPSPPNHKHHLRRPASMKRGVTADRHETWVRDAMAVRVPGAGLLRDERHFCGRRSRVVLALRSRRSSSRRRSRVARAMVATKPWSPRRARRKP
jgi:hypothetical protein